MHSEGELRTGFQEMGPTLSPSPGGQAEKAWHVGRRAPGIDHERRHSLGRVHGAPMGMLSRDQNGGHWGSLGFFVFGKHSKS